MEVEAYLRKSRLFQCLRSGPHGQLVERYAARLIKERLVRLGTWRCLNVVGGLLSWIASRRCALTDLNEHVVERYLRYRGGQAMKSSKSICNVATLIERYFTERLMRQRNVSANTIASYRDTFRLLFSFAQARLRKPPSALSLGDLDAPFIGAFLTDLETRRGAAIRTRNLRLTAIRSFFRFVSFEEPAHSAMIQRVLAIPSKRHDKRQVHFLARPEIEAILAAPDRATWLGRRDHTLLLVAVQTGLRLSELTSLDRDAAHLGVGAHVRCVGKGRKERCTPLTTLAQRALQSWLKEPARKGAAALFPNVHGGRLSADSVQSLLAKLCRMEKRRRARVG